MADIRLSLASLVVAGTILRAREMLSDVVKCRECEGTGSTDPDCRACKGHRSIKIKHAYALGYRKIDLEDVDESDGYCECPVCDADTCDFCQGDGSVPRHEQEQQLRRALIFARYQKLPPLCTVDYGGRRRREFQLLSAEAAGDIIETGKAFRRNVLAFGDEFYLHADVDFLPLWRDARAGRGVRS
jgi:hypothetical protein